MAPVQERVTGLPMSELRDKAVKGVFWSGAQIWGARLISFVTFTILSRLLTPEAFGLVALASLFITFVQAFQDQGFGDAIVQSSDLPSDKLDTAFWTNVLIGVLSTVLGVAGAGLVAELFHQPELTPIIRWLSLSFLFLGLSGVQQAILRRRLAFKELAMRTTVALFLSGLTGVILALLGFGVWSLVVQDLLNVAIGVIVLWNVSHWRPRFVFSRKRFDELFSFGLNIIGINLLNFVNSHADDLLIGYFLGPTLLGFYTVAYKLFGVTRDLMTSVINAVALPTFARLQGEPVRMRKAFYQAISYASLIAFPAFIGMSIIAPQLISGLFGKQWQLSIPVLQVLAWIGILHSVFYFHDSLIIALGKPSWRLAMIFLNAVTNLIAFTIAVRWGIVAVAAAYVIRGYLLSPLEVWMVRSLAGVELGKYFRQFLAPALGCVAMAISILAAQYGLGGGLDLRLQIVIYVAVGMLSYTLVVQWVTPSLRKQLPSLIRLALPQRGVPKAE